MAIAVCASCKSRVEEGAVRCVNCNADLALPGTFTQVLGWVIVAISTIPFAVSEVTTGERDWTPLILGGLIAAFGVVLVLSGRARNKTATNPVIIEARPTTPQ